MKLGTMKCNRCTNDVDIITWSNGINNLHVSYDLNKIKASKIKYEMTKTCLKKAHKEHFKRRKKNITEKMKLRTTNLRINNYTGWRYRLKIYKDK